MKAVQRPRVAIVGSANADLVVNVDRRPLAGETVIGSDLEVFPGGKGANQAAAAGMSGSNAVFVGCIGSDANGEVILESLSGRNVDVSQVQRVNRPTGAAIILLTPDGENSIVVSPSANSLVTKEVVHSTFPAWEDADIVVLNLEIPMDTIENVISMAANKGIRVLLNAAPSLPFDSGLNRYCDPLVVNEHEAQAVLGGKRATFEEMASNILDLGFPSVVITLGGEGAVFADAHSVSRVSAYKVPVVDTTGAGDAFVGALATGLASGKTIAEAVEFSTAMSALSVQKKGAQSSYPDRQQVEEFISSKPAR